MYFAGRYEFALPQAVYFWASISIGVCFALFVVMVLYRALLGLSFFSLKRRKTLQDGAGLFCGVLSGAYLGWGMIEGGMKPKIERVDLVLKGLQHPFSAVQISDLHIGGLIGKMEVEEIVRSVMELRASVIFLTGDIIDTRVAYLQESLSALGKLNAPLGVYYVLGNHEFFHGVYEVIDAVEKLGFYVLKNENIVLKKDGKNFVNLAGVNDLFGRRFGDLQPDLAQALSKRDEHLPTILLAHQPKFAREIGEDDGIDLILSGHTHGGQIFPFGIFVRLDQPYLAGLYQHTTTTQIYVNRGSGFWGPPMRVGSRAEITYFEFRG